MDVLTHGIAVGIGVALGRATLWYWRHRRG